ncbi:MAG TPA: hypothetical protein VK207_12640 [Bacteroidales bacterium]|nr:hypothetical protein [Bacteroidales bacterium]
MKEEDYIESFIRENRDKFTVYNPPENHATRFLLRLNLRIRHAISIVPHLFKVAIITLLIFLFSLLIWNRYIRWDREYVPLKFKVYGLIDKVI